MLFFLRASEIMRRLFTVGYLLGKQHPLGYIIISFIMFLPSEIVIDNKANENDRSILKAPKPLTEKSRSTKLIKIFFLEDPLGGVECLSTFFGTMASGVFTRV